MIVTVGLVGTLWLSQVTASLREMDISVWDTDPLTG